MRIRDITATGYYGRRPPERDHVDQNGQHDGGLALDSVHVIGVVPITITQLARLWFIPLIEGRNGDIELMTPDLFFSHENNWRFLCNSSEADFGPHTFLMKLMELAGYSENDARRIARDTLIRDLDRQIYGSAQAKTEQREHRTAPPRRITRRCNRIRQTRRKEPEGDAMQQTSREAQIDELERHLTGAERYADGTRRQAPPCEPGWERIESHGEPIAVRTDGDGVICRRRSIASGRTNQMRLTTDIHTLRRWERGEQIQTALPGLSPDEREFLLSGATAEEWTELMGSEDDEDDDGDE